MDLDLGAHCALADCKLKGESDGPYSAADSSNADGHRSILAFVRDARPCPMLSIMSCSK